MNNFTSTDYEHGKPAFKERNLAMYKDFKKGINMSQIGLKYGLCRERVRQIINYMKLNEIGGFLPEIDED
jgi:Mor family transcriptional regulator